MKTKVGISKFEKLWRSLTQLATNGLGLGEVGELEVQMFI
jgi:hypothetical protein